MVFFERWQYRVLAILLIEKVFSEILGYQDGKQREKGRW